MLVPTPISRRSDSGSQRRCVAPNARRSRRRCRVEHSMSMGRSDPCRSRCCLSRTTTRPPVRNRPVLHHGGDGCPPPLSQECGGSPSRARGVGQGGAVEGGSGGDRRSACGGAEPRRPPLRRLPQLVLVHSLQRTMTSRQPRTAAETPRGSYQEGSGELRPPLSLYLRCLCLIS